MGALARVAALVLVGADFCAGSRQPIRGGKLSAGPAGGDGGDGGGGGRLLDRVPLQQVHLDAHTVLDVRNAIPVHGGGESSVAFLLGYDDGLWKRLEHASLFCATEDGSHRAALRAAGGETDAAYKTTIALSCDWPASLQAQRCQSVVIQDEHSASLGTLSACNDPELHKESYELAACIAPIFEDGAHLETSGVLKLPQWIEYNAMHGVQQFMVYSFPDSPANLDHVLEPYVKAKLVTKVALQHSTSKHRDSNSITANDCLYRMKHRAKWLMPYVDSDEYLNFSPGGKHEGSFTSGISELLGHLDRDAKGTAAVQLDERGALLQLDVGTSAPEVHSLSFGRYTFRYPPSPVTDLQLSSVHREAQLAPLCPKYITRPEMVNALFNHWPTSWKAGSKNVMFQRSSLVGHHYRTWDTTKTTAEDRSLEPEATEVGAKLAARYGASWGAYASALYPQARHATALMEVSSQLGLGEEIALRVPDFVRRMNALEQPEVLIPPSARAMAAR